MQQVTSSTSKTMKAALISRRTVLYLAPKANCTSSILLTRQSRSRVSRRCLSTGRPIEDRHVEELGESFVDPYCTHYDQQSRIRYYALSLDWWPTFQELPVFVACTVLRRAQCTITSAVFIIWSISSCPTRNWSFRSRLPSFISRDRTSLPSKSCRGAIVYISLSLV
jgi:hypothetical protein